MKNNKKYLSKLIVFFTPKIFDVERRTFYGKPYTQVKNTVSRIQHKNAQIRVLKLFKKLYEMNNGKVFATLRYFEPDEDLGIWEYDDIGRKQKYKDPTLKLSYTVDEYLNLKKFFSRLTGKELIYEKMFELKGYDEFEILMTYQVKSLRNIMLYFKNLNIFIYTVGDEGHVYELDAKNTIDTIVYEKMFEENNFYYYYNKDFYYDEEDKAL